MANKIQVKDPVFWINQPTQQTQGKQMGWIASQYSLQEQGYYDGQTKIWLPKPNVKAYAKSSGL